LVLRNVSEAIHTLQAGVNYKREAEREDADEDAEGKEETGRPMLHRDIKPSNIFLKQPSSPYDSYPHPVVADFDALMLLDDNTKRSQKGTFSTKTYAAPVSSLLEKALPQSTVANKTIGKLHLQIR
jgi:serine/threonine protein kinase